MFLLPRFKYFFWFFLAVGSLPKLIHADQHDQVKSTTSTDKRKMLLFVALPSIGVVTAILLYMTYPKWFSKNRPLELQEGVKEVEGSKIKQEQVTLTKEIDSETESKSDKKRDTDDQASSPGIEVKQEIVNDINQNTSKADVIQKTSNGPNVIKNEDTTTDTVKEEADSSSESDITNAENQEELGSNTDQSNIVGIAKVESDKDDKDDQVITPDIESKQEIVNDINQNTSRADVIQKTSNEPSVIKNEDTTAGTVKEGVDSSSESDRKKVQDKKKIKGNTDKNKDSDINKNNDKSDEKLKKKKRRRRRKDDEPIDQIIDRASNRARNRARNKKKPIKKEKYTDADYLILDQSQRKKLLTVVDKGKLDAILEVEKGIIYAMILQKYVDEFPDFITSYIRSRKEAINNILTSHQRFKKSISSMSENDISSIETVRKKRRQVLLSFGRRIDTLPTIKEFKRKLDGVYGNVELFISEKRRSFLSSLKEKKIEPNKKRLIKYEIIEHTSRLYHQAIWELYQKIETYIVDKYRLVEAVVKAKSQEDFNENIFKELYYHLLLGVDIYNFFLPIIEKHNEKLQEIFVDILNKPVEVTINGKKETLSLKGDKTLKSQVTDLTSVVKCFVEIIIDVQLGNIELDRVTTHFNSSEGGSYFSEEYKRKLLQDAYKELDSYDDKDGDEISEFNNLHFAFFKMIHFKKVEKDKKVPLWGPPKASFWYCKDGKEKYLLPGRLS